MKGNVCLLLLFGLMIMSDFCEPMKIINMNTNTSLSKHNNYLAYETSRVINRDAPSREPTTTMSPTTQAPPEPVQPIKEILHTLKDINETLNIIKENSMAMAKAVKNVCPNRYERLVKGCFYVRESEPSSRTVSWVSARLYCQAIDGDLAVVDDIPKFLNYYENQPNSRFQEYHWYGASRIGHEVLYVNGTVLPASSSLWEAGYPGPGNCVALHTSKQKLITTDCTKAYYFICKSDE